MHKSIQCLVCFKPLNNHASLVAGMGPVCRERLKFAEMADYEALVSMKDISEVPNSRSLRPFRNLIMEHKRESEVRLISILGLNNGSVILIDRQKLKDNYDQSTTYSEALAKSLYIAQSPEIEAVSPITLPDQPLIRRRYNQFVQDYRKSIKEREQKMKEESKYSLDFAFGNVTFIRELSPDQNKNREKMLLLKKENQDQFNRYSETGAFQIATFIARLELANFDEMQDARKIILKRNKIEVDVKDYGLIISEMVSGLQNANKPIERYLFKAFYTGNTNLKAINQILLNQDQMEPKDKINSIKVIQVLVNDRLMTQGHKNSELYEMARHFIKKHNLDTHSNWKK